MAEALAALHDHSAATGDSRQAVHNAAYLWAIAKDIPAATSALALIDLFNPDLGEAAHKARAAFAIAHRSTP